MQIVDYVPGWDTKIALWERAAFNKYFAREIVIQGVLKLSKIYSTHSNVDNMTRSCLFDIFLIKCIHISTYLEKKRDPY